MRFIIEESDEVLTTHSGLALVGLLLSNRLNAISVPGRTYTEISNRDVAYSMSVSCVRGKATLIILSPFVTTSSFPKRCASPMCRRAPQERRNWRRLYYQEESEEREPRGLAHYGTAARHLQ